MQISRKRSFLIKNNMTNPYITDGLIAMWDGIWTGGIGKHVDVTQNGWVDCVSNCVLYPTDITSSSILTTNNDNVETCDMVLFQNDEKAFQINETFSSNLYKTIEIVGNSIGTAGYIFWIAMHDRNDYTYRNCYVYDQNGTAFDFGAFGGSDTSFNWKGHTLNLNVQHSTIVQLSLSTISNTNMSIFKNGQFYRIPPAGTTTYVTRNSQIGAYIKLAGKRCKRYCMRLYDRTLSDEEKIFNYQIDKIRFGL